MKFNEIRNMAKGMGINTYGMKKTDVIRSIQRAENNIDCYGTPRVDVCNEETCLWRNDCLSNNYGRYSPSKLSSSEENGGKK